MKHWKIIITLVIAATSTAVFVLVPRAGDAAVELKLEQYIESPDGELLAMLLLTNASAQTFVVLRKSAMNNDPPNSMRVDRTPLGSYRDELPHGWTNWSTTLTKKDKEAKTGVLVDDLKPRSAMTILVPLLDNKRKRFFGVLAVDEFSSWPGLLNEIRPPTLPLTNRHSATFTVWCNQPLVASGE